MSRRLPPRLSLEELPTGVRAAVEAAVEGEEVELLHDGRTLGTLSFRSCVLQGVVIPAPRDEEADPHEVPPGATVVATAVPLTTAARQRLSESLGDDYVVLDVNEAPDSAEVVLTHAVSPQLLGILRARFRDARVIITEIEDDELDIHRSGPVSRLLDAGASAYLPPRPLDEVATQVRTYLEATDAPVLTASERPAERPAATLPGPREP